MAILDHITLRDRQHLKCLLDLAAQQRLFKSRIDRRLRLEYIIRDLAASILTSPAA